MTDCTLSIPPGYSILHKLIRHLISRRDTHAREIDESSDLGVYNRIILSHKALINKICFYYSSSTQEYEDLLQDTYINIWRGIASFRAASKESTWIYRICLNTCISSWRKNSKHKDGISIESVVDVAIPGEREKEDIEWLHSLIARLNPEEKSIIMMWLDEKSYDEISEVTGFNRNTIATKLRRIKEKLTSSARKEMLNR